MRQRQEQTLGGLCHLVNVIPVWGLILCGWIWYAVREESRYVVRHARQAMVFHAALLMALLVWVVLGLLGRLLSVFSIWLSEIIGYTNNVMMAAVMLIYAAVCLYGCVSTMAGRDFRYPWVRIHS